MNDIVTIVGGKIVKNPIERPSAEKIIALAAAAYADGFGLNGSGLIRKVTGSTITIVVGTCGCTCSTWRNGLFCHHAAMFLVETQQVPVEKRTPAPIQPHRERRPYTRRPFPLRPAHPVLPFRQRPTV